MIVFTVIGIAASAFSLGALAWGVWVASHRAPPGGSADRRARLAA